MFDTMLEAEPIGGDSDGDFDGDFDGDPHGWQPRFVEPLDGCDAADGDPRIPKDLDTMEPSPALAAILAHIDPHRLQEYDRIVVLRARQRMASHYAARVFDDMVAVSETVEDDWDEDPVEAADAAAAEISAALNLTRRAAESELEMAIDLQRRLPRVWESLAAGLIDTRRARAIAHNTVHLGDDISRMVVDELLPEAPDLTSGQIVARLRKLAIEAAPDEAEARYERAVDDRRVVVEPTVEGAANLLGLNLPPHRVAAASRYINRIAQGLTTLDDRTMDQIRADVVLDLLTGLTVDVTTPTESGRGAVDLTVDLATLVGLNEKPGDLGGYGPVLADIARRVAYEQRDAEWTFVVTDRESGGVLHTGPIRRRPTAAVSRAVRARHPRCVFPGCRMPARRCDLDHRIEVSRGGPTTSCNLAPLCRYHHGLRHSAGWTYEIERDGAITWRSRLDHTYRVGADPP